MKGDFLNMHDILPMLEILIFFQCNFISQKMPTPSRTVPELVRISPYE